MPEIGLPNRLPQAARWWLQSITIEALEQALIDVREAADRWQALTEGAALRLTWPRAAPQSRRRPGRGRPSRGR